MSFSAVSASDPYAAAFPAISADYFSGYEINGKTRVSAVLDGGIRNCILLIAGQSNVGNNFPTSFTPTNSTKVDNLNIYDGAVYSSADPLLGTARDSGSLGRGNFAGRLADKLINANKFDRVILVPIGIGGTLVSDWETGIGKDRFRVAVNRLAARSITPTAVLWGQGEQDTAGATSQAAYTASLNNVITNARAAGLGSSVPWFIAQQSWNVGATSANVTNAQAAVVNHGSSIWAGPNADSLNATKRQADNTHFSDTGSDSYAGLWQTALGLFGAPF